MDDPENDLIEKGNSADSDIDSEPPREAAPADTLRILEALLFASDEQLTTVRLKTILPGNPDAREIGKMVERINQNLQKERHPYEIVEIGGGYQFKTVAYYHPWVRQIFQEKAAKRLSMQALECLSIIAYRQPLSKAEIEAIRGVLSDGAMKTLLEKRLITITGRSDKPGRPLLYGTTQEFLHYFGLGKITDLPKIEEFEAMVRQKVEDLPIEELKNVQTRAEAAADEATIEVSLPGERAEPSPAPETGGTRPARPDETAVFEMTFPPKAETASGEAAGLQKNAEAVFEPPVHADPEPDAISVVDAVEAPSGKKGGKQSRAREKRVEPPGIEALSTDGETVRQEAIVEKKAAPPKKNRGEDTVAVVFEMAADARPPAKKSPEAGKEDGTASDDDAVFEMKL